MESVIEILGQFAKNDTIFWFLETKSDMFLFYFWQKNPKYLQSLGMILDTAIKVTRLRKEQTAMVGTKLSELSK